MRVFTIAILLLAMIITFTAVYELGLRAGKSQCYPYSVPYSDAQGQGGNQ